jgi:alpha-tubulin suppressor-like RCC1 family protein
MAIEFTSPEGDLEKYFITEYWLLDQYVGDTLWSWGDNTYYQFGIGNNSTGSLQPIKIDSSVTWKQVSCGGFHSLGIKIDNTLWGWGTNNKGQIGVGNLDTQITPYKIGDSSLWKYVSSGSFHSAGLQINGTLWAWGDNNTGQLGLGDNNNRSVPVKVVSDIDWKQVSCGSSCSTAIKTDGTLWTWGLNNHGQLGLGDFQDRNSPTQVGTDTDWKLISINQIHTLAIKNDGSLWTWGRNYDPNNSDANGVLGLGNNVDDVVNVPTRIGSDYDWKSISCGAYHSAAIKTNKSLWLWGRNKEGQLGTSDNDYKNIPTEVSGENILTWKQVSCGDTYTIGLKLDGTLWSWGDNQYYQLGNNNTTQLNSPLPINKFRNNWKQVSSGYHHSAAVTSGSNPTLYL